MPSPQKKPRKTPEQRIADLKKKQDQLAARIKDEQAKIRTAARKEDTHCKVVLGALVMAHCAHDAEFSAKLKKLVHESKEKEATKQKVLSRI